MDTRFGRLYAASGTELSANNGIETSPDDREFYVASTTTKRIVAFARDNPSKPLRVAQLKEFGPDNVRWTSDNRLITAGMLDNEPACGGAPKDEKGIRCPRGYVVVTIDPKTDGRHRSRAGARDAGVHGDGDRDGFWRTSCGWDRSTPIGWRTGR